MAKREIDPIVSVLNSILWEHGYVRQKKTWYAVNPETVLVIELFKPPVGSRYLLSFGVLVRELCDVIRPKLIDCHIQRRIEALIDASVSCHGEADSLTESGDFSPLAQKIQANPCHSVSIDAADLHSDTPVPRNVRQLVQLALNYKAGVISDNDRESVIRYILATFGFPFLSNLDSLEKIRKSAQSWDNSVIHVHPDLKRLLALPHPN